MAATREPDTQTAMLTVVGAFDSLEQAEQALSALRTAGFAPEQVSVVAKDRPETQEPAVADQTEDGAASGAVTGGALGALAGFLAGISALTLPGVGPIVGAGLLVSTLAGAGIGAATGGLIGALVEQGVPEEEARGYEAHVGAGRVLLSVRAQGAAQAELAESAFNTHGGKDVRTFGVTARPLV